MKASTEHDKWVLKNCADIFKRCVNIAHDPVEADLLFVTLALQYYVRKSLFQGQDQPLTSFRY